MATRDVAAASPPLERRERIWLVCGLALALLVRLLGLVVFRKIYFGDEEEYQAGAQRILAGLPLAARNTMLFVRAPGYSTFIALVWMVTGGQSVLAIKVVQAILGTATCGYVFALTRLFTSDRRAPRVALGATALYPYLVYQCAYIGTESVFAFLVASSSYYLVRGMSRDRPALGWLLLGSTLLSVSNLIRPNLTVTLPLAGLWLLYRYRRRLVDAFKVAAVVLAPVVLLALPWSFAVHKQGLGWMWVTDGAGIWYWVGHQDGALLHYGCVPATAEDIARAERWMFLGSPVHDAARALPMDRQQEAFWKAGRDWDRQNPDKLPCVTAGKVIGYWRPWVKPTHYGRRDVLVSLYSLPVLVLGIAGLVMARRRGERVLTTWTILNMVAGTVTAAIFSTEVRYRIPIVDVLLLPFFGLAVVTLWRRLRAKQAPVDQ
jgi:hypothetical protein